MSAQHVRMCPVMADDARCVTVGGTDSHHDRGRAGDCRCGVKCQCDLIRAVRADEREMEEVRRFLDEDRYQTMEDRLLKAAAQLERWGTLLERVKNKRRIEQSWITNDPDNYNSTMARGAYVALCGVIGMIEEIQRDD